MKVNVAIASHNSADWERVELGRFDRPPDIPDHQTVERGLALGDLAEPLGFDGIWVPEHCGTPYGMSPNPLQVLAYFAGRTERVSLGTMVAVLPWWHPVRFAHQVAYLDILSCGRFDTIGLGRGTAKSEFDAVGVDREQSRQRFSECIDILELALTTERFSYEGEIFRLPKMSLRPQPRSKDLMTRLYGASSTNTSLEIMARRGLKPLFVGNKPLAEACKDVQLVNTYRADEGLAPCQSKNILFTYCTPTTEAAAQADAFIQSANREVRLHYGFGDPSQFKGVKGYEAYAAGEGRATAVTSDDGRRKIGTGNAYDPSNLLVGTPEKIIERIIAGQKACSFCEITIAPHFGGMSHAQAEASLRLFAAQVLPVVHKMEAPLHATALPPARERANA
jgi:alkanesulfonate monooxygenase SsuD/methylene tetrahydromethanopterin reductase-like flavin-dependent oxidoreductase (luciferase family)